MALLESVAVVALGVLLLPLPQSESPFRDLSFDRAREAAAAEGKLVLVDFYTTWCPPCKALDAKTWPDPAVKAWLAEKTVPIKVDAEKETALAARYRVDSYPTILIARPDGTEVDRILGFRTAEAFLSDANDALAGRDALARAKEALERAGATDPMARMDYGDALAEKGRYQHALGEYLWCYDHGLEHQPSFVGVRASFLLGAIARLGAHYPPAIDALRERRDAAEAKLRAAAPAAAEATLLAGDVVALNRTLGEEERTLAVFDALRKHGDAAAEARRTIVRFAFDDFLAARRYADVLATYGEPAAAFRREVKWAEEATAGLRAAAKEGAPGTEDAPGTGGAPGTDGAPGTGGASGTDGAPGTDSTPGTEGAPESDGAPQSEGAPGAERPSDELAAEASKYLRRAAAETGARLHEALLGAGRRKEAAKLADEVIAFEPAGETYAMLMRGAARAGRADVARQLAKRGLAALPAEEHAPIRAAQAGGR